MRPDQKGVGRGSNIRPIRVFPLLIFLVLSLFPLTGYAQGDKGEKKEISDQFSLLIENGSRMIRENESERVLSMIRELPPEKKIDFRIRVLENFANLKAYVVTRKKEYGKKWQVDYKPMIYTGDKTATSLLVDLLQDSDPYIRAFVAKALGYLGDQRALGAVKKVANSDPNFKVRVRASTAYKLISGEKVPEEQLKED